MTTDAEYQADRLACRLVEALCNDAARDACVPLLDWRSRVDPGLTAPSWDALIERVRGWRP